MTIIDHNESRTFHPSLDIKDSIIILGFRRKKEDGKETDIYIVKIKDSVSVSENTEIVAGDNIKISIEKKKRLLAKLSQKWSADGLNKYIESFENPQSKQVTGNAIFNKIKENLKLYIELENTADYSILSAWCMGTYFFPSFSAYPYIHIKAPKGSGKSQCLNFIAQIAFNAVKARASLPALRDTVDALRGTYIMDQADSLFRNNMEDFLDVLTDSYKRGGGNIRKMIANKNVWTIEEFDAYGPKAFGSINQLPEDLRDRCIVVPLIRSKKNHPQIDEENNIWKETRSELYMFLLNNYMYVSGNYLLKQIEYKKNADVLGRQLELWLPIEAILSSVFASSEEIETCKERFLSRYEFASYQANEIELAVIDTIILLIADKEEMVLRPKEIAERIDVELFEDDDKFIFASKKQKSTMVGRAISKFNLATNKLPRDNQGERYLFNKMQLKKIHDGYFSKNEEKDTQTYTDENTAPKQSIFSDIKSVT
jgi:hypothetical protein